MEFEGAMSGEYSGWIRTSQPSCNSFCLVTKETCGLGLSWWKVMCFLLTNAGCFLSSSAAFNWSNQENLGFGNAFLDTTPVDNPWQKGLIRCNLLKLKFSTLWKTLSREWKDKSQIERKYLQKTYLIKHCYPNIQSVTKDVKKLKLS